MKGILYTALLVGAAAVSTPAFSQEINTSSGSNATSASGSASNAASDVSNAANNNIGNSTSVSGSNATANSGSNSASQSNGNLQDQGQGQTQQQGQMTDQANSQAANQSTNLTFNSSSPDKVQVRTNTPVGLAASSSFSSDYCGGTVSGGGSLAPLGISIGGSGPKFDKSCQALRRAEKFGMAAANAQNMGQPDLAQRLMTMMIWSICTADSNGPEVKHPTAQACEMAGLLGSKPVAMSQAPVPAKAPEPRVAGKDGKITPEAAYRAAQDDRMAQVSR